jgi:hypothetical protein
VGWVREMKTNSDQIAKNRIFYCIFLRFTAEKVCTSCSRTSYRIVPSTNLNKYLHNDTSETEANTNVSVNNGNEQS